MYNGTEFDKALNLSENLHQDEAQSLEINEVANDELNESIDDLLNNVEEDAFEDTSKLESTQDVIEALGLSDEEAAVFQNIVENQPVDGAGGYAKVTADCASTTCTYTTSYYYCASTKD